MVSDWIFKYLDETKIFAMEGILFIFAINLFF